MSKIYAQSSSVISSNSQEKQNKNCQWIMMLKIIINTKLTNTTLGDEHVKIWILKAAEILVTDQSLVLNMCVFTLSDSGHSLLRSFSQSYKSRRSTFKSRLIVFVAWFLYWTLLTLIIKSTSWIQQSATDTQCLPYWVPSLLTMHN